MSVCFGSGVVVSVVRRRPDVRSLEVVRRPGLVGRPEPGDFKQSFFFISVFTSIFLFFFSLLLSFSMVPEDAQSIRMR